MCSAASTVVATNVNLSSVSPQSLPILILLSRHLPKKRTKHNRRNPRTIKRAMSSNPPLVPPPTRDSHKSREPEKHSQELNAADGELVCCAGEARRCEDEVGDCEQRPDRGEEHE
jgi:hypothetical protein